MACIVTVALGCLTVASTAAAAGPRPEPLLQFPADGLKGSGAGQLDIPTGAATSPVNGHVYVGNRGNLRVEEFTAWGEFVRAFGWNVNAANPEEKLQVCTLATGCQKGSNGDGNGQFSGLNGGLAIDPSGNVYVGEVGFDAAPNRVQKFTSTGEFLLAFGSRGTGDGQFSNGFGNNIALSPDGASVYVGDEGRIQEFGADGNFKGQLSFKALHEQSPEFPEDGRAFALASDPDSGDLYLVLDEGGGGGYRTFKSVFKLDPDAGKLLGSLNAPTMTWPQGLAVDSEGAVYVASAFVPLYSASRYEVLKFDAAGGQVIPDEKEEEESKQQEQGEKASTPFEPYQAFAEPRDRTRLMALAVGGVCGAESDTLYVVHSEAFLPLSYIRAYGPPPQDAVKCPPPPPAAPEVESQYAISVGTDDAVLGAEINPHYALDGTYYVQYGTGRCSEGGCEKTQPLAPGTTSLPNKVSDAPLASSGVFLSDLAPGAVYHYRFVVKSSGGGPIYGLDPDGEGPGKATAEAGLEGSFTTFPIPQPPQTSCPNQAFRTGASAQLSDCRAYELVSPPHRSPAGDIVGIGHSQGSASELNQSAADGERLAYTSEYAFGDALGAPGNSEYLASRLAGGWSTHAISPPRGSHIINRLPNLKFDVEEKAFTSDLCTGWLFHVTDPPLSGNAVAGLSNLYQRRNCGPDEGAYESITTVAPVGPAASSYGVELQGFSSDGSRTVFRAKGKLTVDAPDLGSSAYDGGSSFQLYESSGGSLHFICRLPDGSPHMGACSAGTENYDSIYIGRLGSVTNAVSSDGSRVYWNGGNNLYLRVNADEEQSAMSTGKCTEEERACTYAVSAGVAQFWTAAADGSVAFYGEPEGPGEERLRAYDAETKKSKTIASRVVGVAGASEDGSRVYFGSRRVIGGEGKADGLNLYLSDDGKTHLVATLSEEDMGSIASETAGVAIFPFDRLPLSHGARASADGRQLLFASSARLTDYDNRDLAHGRPDKEIYLYEIGAAGPVCISCNPSGARPAGREVEEFDIAARIPSAQSQLYTPRALSADGNRIFFDSFEGLVARDTNGKQDTYEWERATDAPACKALGAELYVPGSGGCLSLISSGEGQSDSEFVDASANGRDVFFRTADSLLPQDTGLIDIYDARELGGFVPEPGIPPACEGEACQGPPTPPNDPTPASSAFRGAGNVATPKPCRKGKGRRNGRCVAKKKQYKPAKGHKKASNHRRSAR